MVKFPVILEDMVLSAVTNEAKKKNMLTGIGTRNENEKLLHKKIIMEKDDGRGW